MRAVSLFSGVGGLDLAVAEVFGAEPVAFCEFERHPSAVLAAHWPDVPNLGDVTTAAWEDWAGVDLLHGGPPCQPTSNAGKRKGEADDRWMWPAALDALRRVRPRWVVWENPSALLGLGGGEPFGRILSEMAEAGYVGSYGCLRASDVGACHGRDRLFILGLLAADPHSEPVRVRAGGVPGTPGAVQGDSAERERVRADDCNGGTAATDADHRADDGQRARPQPDEGSLGVDWGQYAAAIARHAAMLGRPAPAPVDDRGRLSAEFVQWMQCFPPGWVTDVLPRNPALKALGNAVVPVQGAAALRMLLARVAAREPAPA